MAIELRVSSVTALVTGEPRERQMYEGRGEARRVIGRFTDDSGRPLSTVNAVVMADAIGLLPDAQVQLPDLQMTGLVPGAVVRIEGNLTVRLAGGDFAAIRATVTGERIEPIGRWADWISTAMNGKAGKPGEPRAA